MLEWLGIWIVLGLMGNERVSKQNGVEALCGDCNTLEEIGRFPWIPRDLADSATEILEEGNRRGVRGAQSLEIIIIIIIIMFISIIIIIIIIMQESKGKD